MSRNFRNLCAAPLLRLPTIDSIAETRQANDEEADRYHWREVMSSQYAARSAASDASVRRYQRLETRLRLIDIPLPGVRDGGAKGKFEKAKQREAAECHADPMLLGLRLAPARVPERADR